MFDKMAMRLVFLAASGAPYLVGITMIALAAALPAAKTKWRRATSRVGALIGLLLIVASATPVPVWLATPGLLIFVFWLVSPAIAPRRHAPLVRLTRAGLLTTCVLALAIELPYWLPPAIGHIGRVPLYVIGDSLSAGVGAGETVWPQHIAAGHGVTVVNLARAGATTEAACKQADDLPADAGLVLVAIGGNDVIGDCCVADFELNLDYVLTRARTGNRPVVMLELPLPPFANRYGAVQRRLARKHGVTLVPKHYLAGVLARSSATTDGLHLSNEGHRLLADRLWAVVGRAWSDRGEGRRQLKG